MACRLRRLSLDGHGRDHPPACAAALAAATLAAAAELSAAVAVATAAEPETSAAVVLATTTIALATAAVALAASAAAKEARLGSLGLGCALASRFQRLRTASSEWPGSRPAMTRHFCPSSATPLPTQ